MMIIDWIGNNECMYVVKDSELYGLYVLYDLGILFDYVNWEILSEVFEEKEM